SRRSAGCNRSASDFLPDLIRGGMATSPRRDIVRPRTAVSPGSSRRVLTMWFRQRLKSVIALAVGSASLAYGLAPSVAWASPGSIAAPAPSARQTRYDGETLFRGLFFRQGPVAERLPSLSIAPTPPTGQGALVLDTLIAK